MSLDDYALASQEGVRSVLLAVRSTVQFWKSFTDVQAAIAAVDAASASVRPR